MRNGGTVGGPYSTLILASLMIGPHKAASATFIAVSSCGVEPCDKTPSTLNFPLIAGSRNIAAISAFDFGDDVRGGLRRYVDRVPRRHVIPGHARLGDGRHFRQVRKALGADVGIGADQRNRREIGLDKSATPPGGKPTNRRTTREGQASARTECRASAELQYSAARKFHDKSSIRKTQYVRV